MNAGFYVARAAAVEAMQRKESLQPLFQAAINAPPGLASDTLGGLVDTVCRVIDCAQKSGLAMDTASPLGRQIVEASPNARLMLLTIHASKREQETGHMLADLCNVLHALSGKVDVSFPKPPPPEPPEATPRAAEPPPLRVEIVGLPERVTETTVTRDGDGNIKRTVQTEYDEGS